VTSANQRSALAALHQVRPTIARLDVGRHSEDVAADLIEAWNGTEIALRSLVGGSALSGQPLIRELRQRELLSLSQAHALIEFLAARDRAERTDYRPTSADVAAARHGFQELEGALTVVPAPELSTAAGAPIPAADQAPATEARGSTTRRMPRWALVVAGLVVLVVPVGGYFAWSWWSRRDERAIVEAAALYQRRQLGEARRAFEDIARDYPRQAEPHIYLARIAREEGDLTTARERLDRAIRLEPTNALALREMGTLMFVSGNLPAAQRFYDRAIRANPDDRLAMGMYGCTLARMGRPADAVRFLQRAGPGEWNRICPLAPPSA
jgi:cytochrome c-type biogenesis protein CcmH/NrfG